MGIDGRASQATATWNLRRRRRRRTAILRAFLLSVTVITFTAATGALLAGLAPTSPAELPDRAAADPVQQSASEEVFAQSMVFSGTAALTLSVAGLVIVAWRRRRW